MSKSYNGGCLFVIIISVPIFWVVIDATLEWYQVRRQWVEIPSYIVTANLVETVLPDKNHSVSYSLEVSYWYTFKNAPYEGSQVFLKKSWLSGGDHKVAYNELSQYVRGKKPFHCYVNPANPTQVVLYRHGSWIALSILLLIGLVPILVLTSSMPVIWNILILPTWFMTCGAWVDGNYMAMWVAVFPLVGLSLILRTIICRLFSSQQPE